MDTMQLIIRDASFEMVSTFGLIYAIQHWDEFAKEMCLDKGPDGEKGLAEMRDEICHFAAQMVYENSDVLKCLLVQWGEERTTAFVNLMLSHSHENGEENGGELHEKALS